MSDITIHEICSTAGPAMPCGWCSGGTVQVFHNGPCPRVKAIEYHQDGKVKRVEFVPEK